jgi:small GTP-binding protein
MSRTDLRATLLTPRGAGGVAVVRVTGAQRAAWVAALTGGRPVDSRPRWCALRVGDQVVDAGLAFARADQPAIELHVHGSEVVLQALESLLGEPLVSAEVSPLEAILQHAVGEAQVDFALDQLRWHMSPSAFAAFVATATPDELRACAARSAVAAALCAPLPLVLIGRQNAGKSTLMNRLLARDRVLAGPMPGLTRDPVRECVELDGYPYELIDTAGEGDAIDSPDIAALDAGRRLRQFAATVLVVDGSIGLDDFATQMLSTALLVVRTKGDLRRASWPAQRPPDVDVEAVDPATAPRVRSALGIALRNIRQLPPAGAVGGIVALTAADRELLAHALVA